MRRIALLIALLMASSLPAADKGSDWPGFLGPTGNSVSPEKGIISPWPKDGPRVVWYEKVGEGYAPPSVSKGKLYLFEGVTLEDENRQERNYARLTCREARTGKFLWKFDYPTDFRDKFGYSFGPRCCPVIHDDRVYIYGPEGMLHCLSTDGKLLWKLDTMKTYGVVQNFFGVGAAPVIEGDLLILQVGGSPKSDQEVDFEKLTSNGSAVVALDRKTGKEKWRCGDDLASYASPVLATINNRRWLFQFARGGLLGIDPGSGKVRFRYPYRCPDLESVNASNPVVVGDRVFITECYGPGGALLQIKDDKPILLWSDARKAERLKSLACHWMTPIHHAGYLYGCSGRHPRPALLQCVELETGKVAWSVRNLTRTSLLMVDGHFVCLGEIGELRLLRVNPKKYEEISVVEELYPPDKNGKPDRTRKPLLEYPCWAAPILSHGLMYVRGKDYLVCLELIPTREK